MKSTLVQVHASVDVVVKNIADQELPQNCFDVENNGDEIIVRIKGGTQAAQPDFTPMLTRVRDLAQCVCPEFVEHLDRFQREVEMEWLRVTK